MRASAGYRMMAAKNLLRRFYLESTGGSANLSRYEAA
jgi:xanthine dehydrogenase small subunit